jgi:hypothetical protein
MNDNRRAPRQRTFKGGSVSMPGGTAECIIRNLSETGALIEFKRPIIVPDNFILIIKPELLRRACVVAWRSGSRIGVRFS